MFNRLNEAEKRYLEIETALADPETASNQAEFAKAMRKSEGTTVDAKVSNLTKSSVRPRTYTDYSEYQYRIDGNNVDIEKENVYLAENQIKYEALINGITAEFTNLKSVMK